MKLEILAASPLWRRAPFARAGARKALAAAARRCGVKLLARAEVSLHLADDSHVRALNAQWRGIDKPTNVLSFPAADPKRLAAAPMLGDIVLAYETLAREAAEQGLSLEAHFLHLTVHGFLHLAGFDHQTVKQARQMEGLETEILAGLGIGDPYRE